MTRNFTEGRKDRRFKHLPRKDTEKTEEETRKTEEAEEFATEWRHIFQSRMRERRLHIH